jgi:hypothetical protein
MSFALTTGAIRQQSKTVTRRTGWLFLKPGDLVQPVRKCMGLKPGEKIEKLGPPIRVVSVRRERLYEITEDDVAREGFSPSSGNKRAWFISMFCLHMKCTDYLEVTRIEFEYTAAPGETVA